MHLYRRLYFAISRQPLSSLSPSREEGRDRFIRGLIAHRAEKSASFPRVFQIIARSATFARVDATSVNVHAACEADSS